MPADIQEPLELVEDMLRAWENGAEVVFSVPQNRVEVGIHRIFAKLFHRLFQRFVSRVPPAYTYLIDRKVLNELRGIREVNANLVALIYWMGYRQEIIDFIKRERSGGKSKWTFGRKLKLVIDSFVGFSYLPLRIISYAGLLLSFLAAGYAISIIVSKLLYGTAVQGWASLMVVIIAMFGILFFFLGIIGEYLWRVLDEARSRPLYIIRQDTFSIRRDGITIQSKKDGEADL
jgi:dolichol-phosphate mannosyltransferase